MNEEQNKDSPPLTDANQQQEPQLNKPSTDETIVPAAETISEAEQLAAKVLGLSADMSDPNRKEAENAILSSIRRVSDETQMPLNRINSDVPKWMSDAVDKLLAKEPKDRYASAHELAQEVERWSLLLGGERGDEGRKLCRLALHRSRAPRPQVLLVSREVLLCLKHGFTGCAIDFDELFFDRLLEAVN